MQNICLNLNNIFVLRFIQLKWHIQYGYMDLIIATMVSCFIISDILIYFVVLQIALHTLEKMHLNQVCPYSMVLFTNMFIFLTHWWCHTLTNGIKNCYVPANLLVISKNGASGDYPSCTNLAYQKAISDGVDFIDCPVQMSKDGVPFCLSFINLINSTNAAQSKFNNITTTIPSIMAGSGIFSFSLNWDEIQTLIRKLNWFLFLFSLV